MDFVIETQEGLISAIEVKHSEIVNEQDFKGIKELESHVSSHFNVGIVLYSGKEVVPFGKNKWAVPFHILWQ